ncbi:MAG: T9SS type A sorting domain-containing protein [Ignavibacteria bacterium]
MLLSGTYGASRCFVDDGVNLFAGGGGGVFLSTNNGNSWSSIKQGLTNTDVRSLVFLGTDLFAGTYGGGVFRSSNNGTNWSAVNSGLTDLEINCLTVSGTNLFAGTDGGGIFLSTNLGQTWTQVNSGLTGISAKYVTSIIVHGNNIYAGTDGSGVYISINNGQSWISSSLGGRNVYCFSVSGTNLLAGTYGGVYLSTDYGTNWSNASTGLTGSTGIDVRALVTSGSSVFAGIYNGGVFYLNSIGSNWIEANTGLTSKSIRSLTVFQGYLFAGAGNGIWRRPLSEIITSVKQSSSGLPDNFTLHQNYPNPFNPSTKITWQSPVSGYTTLKVYDVLGREVALLVNEYLNAGSYEVEFNAFGLSSGVYLCRLINNSGYSKTIKMLLSK